MRFNMKNRVVVELLRAMPNVGEGHQEICSGLDLMESNENARAGSSTERSDDVLKEVEAGALLVVGYGLDDVDGVEADAMIEHRSPH